jgi:hypothetical protein
MFALPSILAHAVTLHPLEHLAGLGAEGPTRDIGAPMRGWRCSPLVRSARHVATTLDTYGQRNATCRQAASNSAGVR